LFERGELKDGLWSIAFDRYEEIEALLAQLRSAGCTIVDMEIGKPDLEDVFVQVMQGRLGVGTVVTQP
jgi:ABC-2 type transport system ATP-binding protein